MKIENRTPHQDGFYMPGEFEPQDGVILIWPKRPGSWPYEAKEAGKVFAEIANKLAETEKVYMLTEPETEAADREMRRERRTIRARCSEEYIPAIRSWQAARQAARMRQAHLFRG